MEVRQRKSSNSLEQTVVKSHSCYCESKGPIVEKGFVGARIRAIQEAFNPMSVSSWSHSPMIPCLMYQRHEKHDSYPLSKTQTPPKPLRRSSIQPADKLAASFIKPFPQGSLGHGPLNEPGQFTSGSEIEVEPQKNESERDAQTRIPEHSHSPSSEQQVQQASREGSSNDTTSLEESPRPKKHLVCCKTKEQVIQDDCTEDSLEIEPRDNGQLSPPHPVASPKHAKRAFTLQPSAHAPSNTPKETDLRSVSARPMTSYSYHQDYSVFPSQNCENQFSGRAKPQGSITPHRRSTSHSSSLLHIFSGTPEKPQSVPSSGTPFPQTRRNWSWWKLLSAGTRSEAREILDKSPNRSVSDKVEPDDTWPLPEGSDVEYFQTRPAQEAETTPAISELQNNEINLTTLGDTRTKANESRTPKRIQPPEPRTSLSSASAEPDPAPPPQPKPRHPHHHLSVWVATIPLEPLLQATSGTASPVRSQTTTSSESSKRGNRGQKIKRVQVIVTLEGSSNVKVEASMKRMMIP